ncbi:retrotransposon protein, putative, ty1-copia subclass [Tanacetum coccineum]
MTTSSANNSVFRGFFEKQKLTGPNFIDWYRQLRIVLSIEDKLNYLEQPIPPAPVAPEGVKNSVCSASRAGASLDCARISLLQAGRRAEFDSFVQNYNMHSMGKTINELHAMLKLHEQTLPKNNAPSLHAIRAGKVQKVNNKHKKLQPQLAARGQNQGYGKNKLAYAPKPKIPPPPKRENLSKDSICHECGASGSGIFTIELNTFLNRSWIYDTGCDTHICNTTQGLRASRKLKPGEFSFAILMDGIFEIDLSNSYANDSSKYVVSNKRVKLDLDSALLWHCHLGHINKKRIEKLQHDGLLNLTDLRAFEKCVSCMSGKMARKPYTHQVERAKDLLGLIHTDLLKHKHEVFETFKVFQKEVEKQLSKTIKSLRSDHGGEYMSQEFLDRLKDHGIIAHCTPPYTPQHNGMSERRNRTLLDMVRSMMSQTTLPKSFWDYDLETAARILNLGYEALVKRDTLTKPDKLEPRSIKCIFVGYPKETMGYSFYYPPENKVLVARNAEFLENSLITQEASPQGHDMPQIVCAYTSMLRSMKMQSMKDNEVWDLVDLPPNDKTVGSKWLFKKKTDIDRAVHTYKARLMAKGCTQTSGIDYEETFSLVADIRAIRILIAITAFYDYEIWQMDVKTAFLNGYLCEEVYMEQHEGFVNPKNPNRVCKLKHSIYGLEQASRQWKKQFDDEIKKFGFTQNRDEPCVYLKAIGSNVTFLILYVDDILIMENNIPMLQDVKSYLRRCFAMKDLGEATYILGIKIYRDRSRLLIGLCQSAYIETILKRYHIENSKHGSIPMQEKLRLSKSQGASTPAELKHMQNVLYALVVGSIMYDVRCTRPDVANTKDMFLVYGGDIKRELRVSCYTDAGYLTDADDLKSQTGYVFVLNEGAVDWKSVKQSIFATSSADAEYIVAYDASKEVVWVRKSISGLGARHFHAKVHYLREVIKFGDIKLEKVHTDDNLADPFTKALVFPKHSEHTKNIEMLPASSLM